MQRLFWLSLVIVAVSAALIGAENVRMVEVDGEGAKYWPRWRGPSGQGQVARRAVHRQVVADRLRCGRREGARHAATRRRSCGAIASSSPPATATASGCRCSRIRAQTERSCGRRSFRRTASSTCTTRTGSRRRRRRRMVSWSTRRSAVTGCSPSTSTARSPGSTSSAIIDNYHGPAGSPVLYKDRIFIFQDANPAPGQTGVCRRIRQDDRQADLDDAALAKPSAGAPRS